MNAGAELAALFRFVRAPRRSVGPRTTVSFARWLPVVAVTIATALLIDTALGPLATWAGLQSKLPETVTPWLLFAALAWAPIGEELLCRAGLRQALYTLAIGPGLLILAIAPWVPATFGAVAGWALLAGLTNRWLVWRRFRRPGGRFAFGRRFITHYAWVFWAYTLVFALMHVGNYAAAGPAGSRTGVAVLLVLPQLVIGAGLGYVRIRDGLLAAMLMHFAVNGTALALVAVSG